MATYRDSAGVLREDQGSGEAVETPTTSANNAIAPVRQSNVSGLIVKATAGNFYGATITNGTTAGFFIVANLASVPANNTALTDAQILYTVPVAAGAVATAGNTNIPDRATTGVVLLLSTAATTYTQPGTNPVFMRGRAV